MVPTFGWYVGFGGVQVSTRKAEHRTYKSNAEEAMLRKAIATPVGGKPRAVSVSCGMWHVEFDRAGRPHRQRCAIDGALVPFRAAWEAEIGARTLACAQSTGA